MITLPIGEVAARLGAAMGAGIIVGVNRGQHGRAAGLRTMLLVCSGSSAAMMLGQWVGLSGGSPAEVAGGASRVTQGILAGMGFLGAGVIVREGNQTRGVTTAASLWFTTILGLCFGAGLWRIAVPASAIVFAALFLLPFVERYIHADRYCTVHVVARADALHSDELKRKLESLGLVCQRLSIKLNVQRQIRRIDTVVQYKIDDSFRFPQQVVAAVAELPGVIEVSWK